MPATPESRAGTRAFAWVIGPFLSIIAAIVAVRMPNIGPLLTSFFDSPMLVWMVGAMLLLGGVFIIANHQYWSGLSAILISLFGWFLALRGVVLLAAPQLIQRGAAAAQKQNMMPVAEAFFGLLVLVGLWLTFEGWFAKPPRFLKYRPAAKPSTSGWQRRRNLHSLAVCRFTSRYPPIAFRLPDARPRARAF